MTRPILTVIDGIAQSISFKSLYMYFIWRLEIKYKPYTHAQALQSFPDFSIIFFI